jgi:hypothetical protein
MFVWMEGHSFGVPSQTNVTTSLSYRFFSYEKILSRLDYYWTPCTIENVP